MMSSFNISACGLRVEFVVAIDKTRVRVPAGAFTLFYNEGLKGLRNVVKRVQSLKTYSG